MGDTKNRNSMNASRAAYNEGDGEVLNLRELTRLLRMHRALLVISVLIPVVLAMIYCLLTGKIYVANVALSVTPTRSPLGSLAENLVEPDPLNRLGIIQDYFATSDFNAEFLGILSQRKDRRAIAYEMFDRGNPWYPAQFLFGSKSKTNPVLAWKDLARFIPLVSGIKTNPLNNQIMVYGRARDPRIAAAIANVSAQALLKVSEKKSLLKVTEMRKYLRVQTEEMRTKLHGLEQDLVAFEKSHQMTSGEEAERSVYDLIRQNQANQADVQTNLQTGRQLMQKIQNDLDHLKNKMTDSNWANPEMYLSQLQNRLSMLQYQKLLSQGPLSVPHKSDDNELDREIKAVKNSYQQTLTGEASSKGPPMMSPLEYYKTLTNYLSDLKKDNDRFTAKSQVLKEELAKLRGGLESLSGNLQTLGELKQNVVLTSDLYVNLMKRLQEADIEEATTVSDLSVISWAIPPLSPSSLPLGLAILTAVVVGILGGAGIIALREVLMPMVRSHADFDRLGLPFASEIPEKLIFKSEGTSKPTGNEHPYSFEADAFRSLAIGLTGGVKGKKHRLGTTIMVTSPTPGCGKTFVVGNLGLAAAKGSQKTLLIDLDLRRPSLAAAFEGKCQKFFNDSVCEESADDLFKHITKIDSHLDIIASRQFLDPLRFLDSELLHNFIEKVKSHYNLIVIDSPPVLGVVDTLVLAKQVRNVLIVTEYRKTHLEDLSLASRRLRDVCDQVPIGILNKIPLEFTHLKRLGDYYLLSKKVS